MAGQATKDICLAGRSRSLLFQLVSLLMFGFELFYVIRLDGGPAESAMLHKLAIQLVLIYLLWIAPAWDLVG